MVKLVIMGHNIYIIYNKYNKVKRKYIRLGSFLSSQDVSANTKVPLFFLFNFHNHL